MKPSALFFLITTLLAGVVFAWSETDYEIFRLKDEIEATEGPGVTFYDFIGVKPSASIDDISKGYRKRSKALHPDKFKPKSTTGRRLTPAQAAAQKKKASERYARLTTVADILRGPKRENYDYFLKNGFPMWRGTGYYYNRFRPGIGSVLFGLFLICGGGLHYGILALNARQQRKFMENYIHEARTAAFGSSGVPGLDGKKFTGGRRKVMSENGKLFVVEPTGEVSLVEEDADGNTVEWPLDLNEIPGPSIKNTALVRLPKWFFHITIGRFIFKAKKEDGVDAAEDDTDSDSGSGSGSGSGSSKEKKGTAQKVERNGSMPRTVRKRAVKKQK